MEMPAAASAVDISDTRFVAASRVTMSDGEREGQKMHTSRFHTNRAPYHSVNYQWVRREQSLKNTVFRDDGVFYFCFRYSNKAVATQITHN